MKLEPRVTILGLGLFSGGVASARYFSEQGAAVTVTDTKTADELRPSIDALADRPIRYVLGEHRDEDITGADLIVVSPAVPPDNGCIHLAQEHSIPLTTEMNLVFEHCPAPIIGITGSNGKTTTTSLIGTLLKAHDDRTLVGGNIGRSVLNDLADTSSDTRVVLELSSFQLQRLAWIARSPHIAVVTNLSPNHLDWHGDYEAYKTAKQHILRYQHKEDIAVLNADDEAVSEWAGLCAGRVFMFSVERPVEAGCFVQGGYVLFRDETGDRRICPVDTLRLPGRHNLANALAAITVACLCDLPPSLIEDAVAAFNGVPHRLEWVGEINTVACYNDSACTTPDSTIIALKAFDTPVVLIAGGSDKGAAYDAMAEEIIRRTRAVVLIGDTADAIEAAVRARSGSPPTIARAASMPEAVARSTALTRPGDVIVLSPGCASFGLFNNFEDRGAQFKAAVEAFKSS